MLVAGIPPLCGALMLACLQALHVMGNRLASLPEDLARSSSLQELNAADNALTGLPREWFAMQALTSLVLYGNGLTDVPDCIASLPSLASLWIEGNPLDVRAGTRMPHVRWLHDLRAFLADRVARRTAHIAVGASLLDCTASGR